MKRALLLFGIVLTVVCGGVIVTSWLAASPSQAASAGAGFGTWAPTSQYGWHGSMRVGDVHTYCIRPGLAAPTGKTTDHGVRTDAAGLTPQQLTGINHLVSAYGQTTDPVQAASVGWAVKAIADWDETLHSFGYRGDSLAGAINWTFSALAPKHNERVQELATSYYAEATALAAGDTAPSGRLVFTASQTDPLRGTVTAEVPQADGFGTVELSGAVFADGSTVRSDLRAGESYDIHVTGAAENEITVRGSGVFPTAALAAVRYFTTPGGQDTAGPAGAAEITVEGADDAPRSLVFAPTISTQVVDRYVHDGRFVDEVLFAADGAWPRSDDDAYAVVHAEADIYRSTSEPNPGDVPPGEPVATLTLQTDPTVGPTAPYRVEAVEPLPDPGFYTAVWRISAKSQGDEVRGRLPDGYAWEEQYGLRSQTIMVPAISSRAQEELTVGAPMADDVIVDGPVPRDGLVLQTAVFRAVEGIAPEETCTEENLVWTSAAVSVDRPGTTTFTAPEVPDFGTYYWQESAHDAEGTPVHVGRCGVAEETGVAAPPTVVTAAQPTAGFGASIIDTATVSGRVPETGETVLVFRLYRAGDGAEPSSACTEETLVAETTPIPVTGDGEYESPAVATTASGTYYWIEELTWTPRGGDPRTLATGTCGIPEETTVVERPSVTTLATPRAATGEPFTDVATVTGLDDSVDAELVFSAFLHPTGDAAVCSDRIAETEPVPVTGDGEYESPAVTSDTSGTVQWIALLQYRPSPESDVVVIYRGECGEEGESTIVDDLAATGPALPAERTTRIWAAAGAGLLGLGLGALALRTRRP
ncbi:hypothetical protein RZO50_00705 [Microbacterium sp. SSW1-59]|uniref:hypothetical protein n=1 Tax=Microbacterium xanthum TaxID=3079794 RepID=UPI002AD2C103|nr:hypothetical protein [Microbacterium sp. SSW1-59]MDZ8200019.1 hypothetical protein [Microbacterium sp. SSW1-59]